MGRLTSRWPGAAAVVGLVTLGAVVLVQSARGEPSRQAAVATPTRTVDEISRLSDSIQATQTVIKGAALADLIDRGDSVATLPRLESTGHRYGPGGPVPDLNAALATSDRLVIGTVVEQHLEWGVLEPFGFRAPVLVSTVAGPQGEVTRVSQPVDLAERPDLTGPQLTYASGEELLVSGERYALFVDIDERESGRYTLVRGLAYVVEATGVLRPAQGITPQESVPATASALRTAFDTANASRGAN